MLISFILALVFAFIFSALLSIGFKRRGPGPINGLFYFFLIILFVSWATGTWLYPVGPAFGNVPWLGFLISALLIMLFMVVIIPPTPVLPETESEKAVDDVAAITFGFLFWIFIIALGLIALSKGLLFTPAM